MYTNYNSAKPPEIHHCHRNWQNFIPYTGYKPFIPRHTSPRYHLQSAVLLHCFFPGGNRHCFIGTFAVDTVEHFSSGPQWWSSTQNSPMPNAQVTKSEINANVLNITKYVSGFSCNWTKIYRQCDLLYKTTPMFVYYAIFSFLYSKKQCIQITIRRKCVWILAAKFSPEFESCNKTLRLLTH